MTYRHLLVDRRGSVEHLTLNRPDVRNAFNEELVQELHDWATGFPGGTDVRAVVLSGAGKLFCAGADLSWMSRTIEATREENVSDAGRMAAMFEALDQLPVPVIGRIHGAALGGGAGLVAVCDIAVAAEDALFGFTEVKLGILPAVISPYALAKIGRSAARQLFLTGARFPAARALQIGLVHEVVPAAALDEAIARQVREVLSAGPEATQAAKRMIRDVWGRPPAEAAPFTAAAIAARRVSPEGQEGMRAFLQKRRASWTIPKP